MNKIQNKYKVVSNKKFCARFHRLCIDAKPIAQKIRPGQFIHIRINNGLTPFFRRPFSVYRAKKYIEIVYEVVGRGTTLLSQKRKGDQLDILGPLGNPFTLPPKKVKQIVMIAGGVGVAPFLILSDVLRRGVINHAPTLEIILLYGANTRGHVYNMKEFKQNRCKVHIATMDGSVGVKGRVSELFSKIDRNSQTTFIYTCGPRPMMAAVQDFAKKYGIRGQASCEETMACGLGACLGCSVPTKSGYKTACYDGPVFDLNEIVFNEK